MKGRVLVVAGSDSGGGAGIQADIKAITALGAYAATAITALTAQNTLGVQGVLPVPAAFLRRQVESVLTDLGADTVKTGMLGDAETVALVADLLQEFAPGVPLVLDPVMVAKGGARLLDAGAVDALRRRLLPLAALVTPNVPEAEALTGLEIADLDAMRRAADALLAQGMAPRDAVGRARDYVQAAIATAPGYGAGHGPLDHAVTVDVSRIGWPG